ncbi:unnamed protein product [Sympodiomycopsis kandeliae]
MDTEDVPDVMLSSLPRDSNIDSRQRTSEGDHTEVNVVVVDGHRFDTLRSVRRAEINDEKKSSDVDEKETPDLNVVHLTSTDGKMVTPEQQESSTLSFPEGGLKAWLVVSGCFLCFFFTFGIMNSFGILEEYYLSTKLRGHTSSQIAWISSLQYFLIFANGSWLGKLFDCGYCKPMLASGIFLFIFSQMMISISKTLWQLLLSQGVGCGLAFGIIFSVGVSIPTHWFNRKRATVFGIISSGGSIGGIVCPIWIKQMIRVVGFPWAMRIIAFAALLALYYAYIVINTRFPPAQTLSKGGWKRFNFFDRSAFKQPAYTSFVIGTTIVLFGLYTPQIFMEVFSGSHHLPLQGYYLSILNASAFAGQIISSTIADRCGKMNILIPHLAMVGIVTFCYPLCTNMGALVAFSVLFGFGTGCYISLMPPAVAQLGSTSTVGVRLGMMFTMKSIGGLVGAPLAGAILNAGDYSMKPRWWPTMLYAGGCIMVGFVFILASRQFAVRSWHLVGKI